MDAVTERVAEYIKGKGINVSKLSRDTKVPYGSLYASLLDNNRDREIRGKELLAICAFLGVNPMDFADQQEDRR